MKTYLLLDEQIGVSQRMARMIWDAQPDASVHLAMSIQHAKSLVTAHAMDAIIVDLDAFEGQAASVASLVRRLQPQAQVVALSLRSDDAALHRACSFGVSGYVLKNESDTALQGLVGRLIAGEPALSAPIVMRLMAQVTKPLLASDEGHAVRLTARETDVLQRVAKGYTNAEISRQLGLSTYTVTDYIKGVYRKLKISSRVEAAMEAARLGLVTP